MPSHLPRALAAAVAGLALIPAAARADATVHASPAQAAQLLFVAGDAGRLGRNPSGTIDIVLEKVLQQEYRSDAALPVADAQADVAALRRSLDVSPATSTATLQGEPGNQRVLAILAAFERSNPSTRVRRALARVADAALTESSAAGTRLGRMFYPQADSVSTLLYGGFSPTATLQDTVELAARNARFGQARDALWAGVAHESVRDGASALIASNPALQTDAVRALTRGLAADGSLTISAGDLQALVHSGMQAVAAQSTRAIDDHRAVESCNGCDAARDTARADGAAGRETIGAQLAALTIAGGLLGVNDSSYGAAVQAEAQAAAQVAGAVNSYYAAMDYGQYVHIGADVAGLAVGLAVAEVDPAAAITGVLNVVGDIVGVTVTGPDADMLILQGLQGVSQQLSAFAQETSEQFEAVDSRLENLTRSVARIAGRLSDQLTTVQTQLMGLRTALSTLQGSVDRLHSEIQLLFAATAVNDLGKVTAQSIGYQTLNNERLTRMQFAGAASQLYQDATDTADTTIVLKSVPAFAPTTALGLGDLDSNINFFNLFPAGNRDGIAFPGPLSDDCLDNSGSGLCLSDPDFWASSSRAYAQLLLENRDYVTRARLSELDVTLMHGRSIEGALDAVTAKNTDDRTGSKLFNSLLDYYSSWLGRDADRSGAPALLQAIRHERNRFLDTQATILGGSALNLYGGASQALTGVDLLGMDTLQRVHSDNHTQFSVNDLRPAPALISRLPLPVQNALRLGLGHLEVSWHTQWTSPPPAGADAGLSVSFSFTFVTTKTGTRDRLGTVYGFGPSTVNCTGGTDTTGEATFVASWNRAQGCTNWPSIIQDAALGTVDVNHGHDDSGFAQASADATTLVDAELRRLQGLALDDVQSNGVLTHGDNSPANDVAEAADRLAGAQALIGSYVALGLPQALATDDALHSLITGEDSDALAHPYFDARTAKPGATLQEQVARYLEFVRDNGSAVDPLSGLGIQLNRHRLELESAIGSYVRTGRAAGPLDGGRLDETSPLVASTLDRLELTRAVLADGLDHPATATPAPAPAPAPAAPATPAAPQTPVAPAAKPTPPVTARLVHAPRAHGRAVRFTVRCVSGSCRIATTVKAGNRTIGRATTRLAAGRARTVTIRLTAAGRRLVARPGRLRVTVRITVAGRSLATRRIRLG